MSKLEDNIKELKSQGYVEIIDNQDFAYQVALANAESILEFWDNAKISPLARLRLLRLNGIVTYALKKNISSVHIIESEVSQLILDHNAEEVLKGN